MSIPRYPEYKDSGFDRLGAVPKHWGVKQAKYLFRLQRGHDLSSDEMQEGPFPVRGSNGVIGFHDKCCSLGPGVTVGRSGSVGKVNFIQVDFWAHNTALYVIDFYEYPPKYIYYLLCDIDPERLAAGSAVGTLDRNNIHKQCVAAPSAQEASQISRFLDHETAKIDTLIQEQQRLIKLLKEKRQAVISHAVTKGLDPSVPMKDSGVEWLGEVPVGWEATPLRYLLANDGLVRGPFGGDLKKDTFVPSGVKVYEQKNAIYRDHRLGGSYVAECKYAEMSRFRVSTGDYIMSCSGTIGKVYRLPEGAPNGIINQALLIIRFSGDLHFQFADWIFDSEFFIKQILDNSQGGAMKNLVGMDVFKSIKLPVPPHDEQLSIARYLDGECNRIDTLTSQALQVTKLLQERRSALISAAVTGKIDVRNWKPPADESAFDEEVRQAGLKVAS